jgi:4-amino-4-deoxy-L-arabinose transferase-like glycosyltransferase
MVEQTQKQKVWFRRPETALLVIVLTAVFLRLFAVYALRAWENPNAMEHHALANNILTDGGFKTGGFGYYGYSSIQSPVYPYFLAALYYLFGIGSAASYVAAMIFNALLGGLCVWLTYLLVLELGGNRYVGLIAAGFCAVWPTQIYVATHVQAVVLITVFLIVMWITFIRGLSKNQSSSWWLFSFTTAVGILTEPVFLLIGFSAGIAALTWHQHSIRNRLKNGAILLGVTVAIVGPWAYRNYTVHGKLIPVKSSFWVNVWKGNNDFATGSDRLAMDDQRREKLRNSSVLDAERLARDPEFDKGSHQYSKLTPDQLSRIMGKSEIEREEVFKEWTVEWIKQNPVRFFQLCGIRLVKTILVDWDNPKALWIAFAFRVVLLAIAIPGLVIAIRSGWYIGFPITSILVCLLLFSLTITASRFSIPLEPFAFAIGGLSLNEGLRKLDSFSVDNDENSGPR